MSQINKPSDYFNTVLYTGNGSTQSITGVGFQPDFTWIKERDTANEYHNLYDVIRGATNAIYSNDTLAESTQTGLTSFDSDGFSVGSFDIANKNTSGYVSWNWLAGGTASSNTDGSITSQVSASTTSGFSIVSYTGTGATATVGHGLNSAPEIYFTKNLDKGSGTGSEWLTLFTVIDGSQDYMYLNTTDGKSNSSFSAPTSSLINLNGSSFFINTLNERTIMYCFHSVKGFSKIGTYTGNGSTDGTFVYTGFKPAFVILKNATDAATNWQMNDSARDTFNVVNKRLAPSASDAEATNFDFGDFLSNGFKLRQSDQTWNKSGSTYIYMAFAENPLVGTNNIPATAR